MRDYELVFIVSPQVVDEGLTGVVQKVTQFIASRGGQIDRMDSWGKRRLAYPIGPFREGMYFLAQFKMDPVQAPDLEVSLHTAEEVIRHLVIRLDEAQVKQRQRQLAQQKEREEQERARREQAAVQASAAQAAEAEAKAAEAQTAQPAAKAAEAQPAAKAAEAQPAAKAAEAQPAAKAA
ncbi:MAG: 30S ribosomal protein S6, partial [Dehalococcoidia bacterium]|nr:30S ribosomal protein S6 [Dehalococcoidia bacterium]